MNTNRIGMEIYFKAEVIHLFNYLTEFRSTRRILSVEKEIGEIYGGSEPGDLSIV